MSCGGWKQVTGISANLEEQIKNRKLTASDKEMGVYQSFNMAEQELIWAKDHTPTPANLDGEHLVSRLKDELCRPT